MSFFEYMYYVALRYRQGEDSLATSARPAERISAMMTTGLVTLIALLTPAALLVDLSGLNSSFVHTCRATGINCGDLALPFVVAVLLQLIFEMCWLFPRLTKIQERFWPYGRPNPFRNAMLSSFVGLVFFSSLLITSFNPALALISWLVSIALACYLLKVFALRRASY